VEHRHGASILHHHTATARPDTSSRQRPDGCKGTNEDGFLAKLVERLLALYARSDLFRLVVADAGSCSLANADQRCGQPAPV